MRAVTIAALVVVAFAGTGTSTQPAVAPPTAAAAVTTPRSPRNASYAITARLDPATRTITGEQVLTWRNTATRPAHALQFHLYWNAWRNNASTWMREQQLSGRASGTPADADWGWTDLTSIAIVDVTDPTDQPDSTRPAGAPQDVTARLRFIAPDDGNVDDRTVVELPLETPIAPGATISLRMAWSARVPRPVARTGVIGNYYFLGQWFPKIGVFEDSGWNCHQFHASTEFFADFGTYDVRLTVPRAWPVGATGVEVSRHDDGNGTVTHAYHADDVHDFAWTTSADFVERTVTFERLAPTPVVLRLLLQPDHVGQMERHVTAAAAALRYYGEWLGPYPYANLTIVDPVWLSETDGMEYPMLVTAGTRWLAPAAVSEPEDVVIHEIGHQFLYGVVATNEFEDAWMDEGLNTFLTARVIAQIRQPDTYVARYFGGFIPWVSRAVAFDRETDGGRMSSYRQAAHADAQDTPSFRYWPGTAGVTTYNKTALWLHTLERLLGWDTLQRVLSTYYTRYAFAHPRPRDFFAVVNEVSGRDLTWFFDRTYRSSAAFDYGIDTFVSRPLTIEGFVGEGAERRLARPERAAPYRTSVVVRRYEDGTFPVDVRVRLESGEEIRWHWDGTDRWKLFEIDRPSRAVSADIDPERVLLLDVNVTNNSARLGAGAGRTAARRWSLAWLVWLQDQLVTYGFFV